MRWLLALLVLLLVAAASAGGMWAWSNRSNAAAASTTKSESNSTAVEPPIVHPSPIFMSLEPFTVSLQGETMDRMVHIRVNLRLSDDKTQARIENYLPEVRNRVLMLISALPPETVVTSDGKRQLAVDIKHALTQPFPPLTEEQSIMDVLFTEFVVQ